MTELVSFRNSSVLSCVISWNEKNAVICFMLSAVIRPVFTGSYLRSGRIRIHRIHRISGRTRIRIWIRCIPTQKLARMLDIQLSRKSAFYFPRNHCEHVEQTNQQTNQQTRPITIPPGGGNYRRLHAHFMYTFGHKQFKQTKLTHVVSL